MTYRNATYFCILILYPEATEFVYINSFGVESIEFSVYKIMSSTKRYSFTFSFFDIDVFSFFFLPNFSGWNYQHCVEEA